MTRVYACVEQGDPTPFKAFRYNEFQTTVGRMGHLDDGCPIGEFSGRGDCHNSRGATGGPELAEQGALLFGLSDKPDEASIPTPDLAAKGYRPIHRVETHALGE